jgi:hypothetical protein
MEDPLSVGFEMSLEVKATRASVGAVAAHESTNNDKHGEAASVLPNREL